MAAEIEQDPITEISDLNDVFIRPDNREIDRIIIKRLARTKITLNRWKKAGGSAVDVLKKARSSSKVKLLVLDEEQYSSIDMAMYSRESISGETLKVVSETIPKSLIASSMGISLTNLSHQYKKKELTRPQSEEVSALTKIWEEISLFFGGDQGVIDEWINYPLPALQGETPVSLLDTNEGRDAVRNVIERLRFGDYS